jgi:hypothetical protein
VLGVVLATLGRGMANDVYFQVGLITIIGLSAKNAILIIEFAKDLHAQGKSAIEAALEAAQLRFRPIIMTSMAFMLGVMPLYLASGAGSASQRAIGTGVIGGMLTATLLSVFFVPVFFAVVRRLFPPSHRQELLYRHRDRQPEPEPAAGGPMKTAARLTAFLAALLGGCALAPAYERPAAPVAADFPAAAASAGLPAAQLDWANFITDPRSQALVRAALANNRDLRLALLNVEQARGALGIARADRLPTLAVGAAANRNSASDSYTAGLSLTSFELDLFGRVKNLGEAAAARLLASDEARRAVQLSLVTAVATPNSRCAPTLRRSRSRPRCWPRARPR